MCLPFVITLSWGFIETCNVVYMRSRMYAVAYEAARVATRPTTASALRVTDSAVTTLCTNLLTQVGVKGATATLTVVDDQTLASKTLVAANPQDIVTVSITAPLSQNCILSLVLNKSMVLSAQATLAVE